MPDLSIRSRVPLQTNQNCFVCLELGALTALLLLRSTVLQRCDFPPAVTGSKNYIYLNDRKAFPLSCALINTSSSL